MADQDPTSVAAGKPRTDGRRSGSRDPKVFVLLRELSEVHLLLDNVSANPSTTVADHPAAARPKELKDDWIEEVCKISWPPDGSNEDRAEDAALLIRAKDYLNRLSHPASGSTIAFTLLVTQEDAPRWWMRWFGWLFKRKHEDGQESPRPAREPTRNSLARAAYPDLVHKAEGFRRAMWWISILLVVALFITCAVSWYVAYGNAALAELQTARQSATEAQAAVVQAESGQQGAEAGDDADETAGRLETAAAASVEPPPAETAGAPAQPAPGEAGPQPPYVGYCRQEPSNATQERLCTARTEAETNVSRIEQRLASWLCRLPFTDCAGDKIADAPARAASLANIMGSAMLPFLYGLLGAGAAIIRSLSRKIRASLLSPRDLHLSFQQLALGAVVGACIGLFVAAPDAGETGESLLGPVTLSASAISFVAGFGVDAVFQALEALITRIFNISPPVTGNRGDGTPSN